MPASVIVAASADATHKSRDYKSCSLWSRCARRGSRGSPHLLPAPSRHVAATRRRASGVRAKTAGPTCRGPAGASASPRERGAARGAVACASESRRLGSRAGHAASPRQAGAHRGTGIAKPSGTLGSSQAGRLHLRSCPARRTSVVAASAPASSTSPARTRFAQRADRASGGDTASDGRGPSRRRPRSRSARCTRTRRSRSTV